MIEIKYRIITLIISFATSDEPTAKRSGPATETYAFR